MVQSYVMVPIKPEVHEALVAARARVSLMFRYDAHNLGLNPMVAILLAHFEHAPPESEWLRDQVARAPKRGRPQRSKPIVKLDEWGKPVVVPPPVGQGKKRPREHKWIAPLARPDLRVCRLCGQNEGYEFIDRCDWVGPMGQTHEPQPKSGLLALGFTEEEIASLHAKEAP